MKFRKVVAGAVMVQGLALLDLSAANANVILTYTGNDFTDVVTPYTTSDKITATIILASALPPNQLPILVTPISFTLTDGVQTLTNQTPSVKSSFSFDTDSTGSIDGWIIDVQTGVGAFSPPLINTEKTGGFTTDYGQTSASVFGENLNDGGTWTATPVPVPAPPLSNLAALGVLGLAFFWRRRRQILDRVRYSTQP
jgi:MYXO-CTERM domain-containing protein